MDKFPLHGVFGVVGIRFDPAPPSIDAHHGVFSVPWV
jgi:hypothetical protein